MTEPTDETPEAAEPAGATGTEIGRLFTAVVTDPAFKALLLSDPDAALAGFELSQSQVMMIKTLDEEDFDKLTPENLAEYFSADAAVYTPDEADGVDDDAYSEDDFLDLEEEYDTGGETL